jgi:hypothetical protein
VAFFAGAAGTSGTLTVDQAVTEGAKAVPEPAEIQQQIDETRAELASTIDAIAERVSPKRVAARSVETVKGKVGDLRNRGSAHPAPPGSPPAIEGAHGSQPLPARVAAQLREAKETRGKSVRWDRVAIVGGVLSLVVLITKRRGKKKAGKKKSGGKTATAKKATAKKATAKKPAKKPSKKAGK